MGLFSFTQEIAMDLGTANSIIIHNDKIVVDEPSVVAIENKTDKLIAVGTPAHMMEGRESPGIRTIRPLRDGVIADFNAAEQMIRGMVKMVGSKRRWFSPSLRMVVCIPSGSTEVEIRAVRDSSEHAGGRDVYMIYEPMAAALGIGLDVDVGGGAPDSGRCSGHQAAPYMEVLLQGVYLQGHEAPALSAARQSRRRGYTGGKAREGRVGRLCQGHADDAGHTQPCGKRGECVHFTAPLDERFICWRIRRLRG